jgi:hypothetical protein
VAGSWEFRMTTALATPPLTADDVGTLRVDDIQAGRRGRPAWTS